MKSGDVSGSSSSSAGADVPPGAEARPRRRSRVLLMFVLGIVFGLLVGGAGGLVAFSKKSYRDKVFRLMSKAGLRKDNSALFSHGGHTDAVSESWTRVRSPTSPLWEVRPGYDVQRVAGGFTYPINMVFAERPAAAAKAGGGGADAKAADPDAPLFYVNELHGTVKYVTRSGAVHTFAEGLINFDPIPAFKSDEAGISGLATIPGSEDLIVTGTYMDKASGLLCNRVMRLISEPGGRRMREMKVLLDMAGEFTCPSNQIQQALVGPDDKLYVSVGDAEIAAVALDMTKFGGKVLRMELADGSACKDNPFYDRANPKSPRSYTFAYGLRNVFDFDVHPATGRLFGVDNGKTTDRLMHLAAGASYAWNGRGDASRVNALYSWGPVPPTVAPVGLQILRKHTLGPGTKGRMYVATYGPPGEIGANHGKQILEFELDDPSLVPGAAKPAGKPAAAPGVGLARVPTPLVAYAGKLKSTVLGLAEGPDGLYFTDFFGEVPREDKQSAGTGGIWRVFPSDKTLNLPTANEQQLAGLKPAERGRVHFARNCAGCHTKDGVGGRAGPELTALSQTLDRLSSPAYLANLKALRASEQSFLVQQRGRIDEVLSADKEKRKWVWLHHHIEEPRFDNPFATMPSFQSLPKDQRDDIAEYLLKG